MIVTCVHVHVKPDKIDLFKNATITNHMESVKETGNLRFDVLQDPSDPSQFLLYEAYESEEAVAIHKNTPHYFTWRDTVADMMAEPRKADNYIIVAPLGKLQW
jgi:autoinducer 2-degrading protein